METRYACRSYTAGFLFKQVLSGAVQSALLKARLDSLAACFLCLVPIPRQQTEHAGGHTHAVLRSVAEAFVKCVVFTHPDRQ